MKKVILLIFFLLYISKLQGQVFTVTQQLNTITQCCNDDDSIDVLTNSVYDIKIAGFACGIDCNMFYSTALTSNIKITPLLDYGLPFNNFLDSIRIADSGFGGGWNPAYWLPNTGYKYEGFKLINSINDTTYGWVKLSFAGSASCCLDSIMALELTYNIFPNVPLFAGQILPVGVNEINQNSLVQIHQGINEAEVIIVNNSAKTITGSIFNCMGQLVLNYMVYANETFTLNVSSLRSGIYFLNSNADSSVIKIIR